MSAKRQPVHILSGIHGYFGKNTVRAAIADYMRRNGNSEEAREMLTILSVENPDKIVDIICDYLDRKPVA